jgi:uncharacterized lipoprotein
MVMKRKALTIAMLAVMGLATTACSSRNNLEDPVVIHKSEVNALEELKRISIEARQELRLLAKAQESIAQESMTKEQHEQKSFQAIEVPAGFEVIVKDFKYTGPANIAAAAIAKIAGYRIEFTGKPLTNEPFVSLDLDGVPLNEALKEIGMATGDSATVEVHPQANLILYVYTKQ